jgi:hypothetical protein
MYDDVAKLHMIMIGVEVKKGSSWTLMLEID